MTRNGDPDERLRRAFSSLAEGAVEKPDCPSAERIWAARRGELAAEQRRRIVDHLSGCPACAESWRLAQDLHVATTDQRSLRAVAGPSRRYKLWAAAAAVLILVGLATYPYVVGTFQFGQPPDSGFRGGDLGEIRSLISEAEPLPRQHCLLRWSPGPEGVLYELTVTTSDLELVVQVDQLETPEFLIPANDLSGIASGGELFWKVGMTLPDGRVISSTTFVSRLE